MSGEKLGFISKVRKNAVGIFSSCLGFVLLALYLSSEYIEEGSFTRFIGIFTYVTIFFRIRMFLFVPAFILLGYYYQKQKNLTENREWIVEKKTEHLRKSDKKLQERADHLEEMVEERTRKLKKLQETLRESEERLRQLIEYAPDAIYVYDIQGNFIDGNKRAENLVGYKRDELIGKSFLKVGLLPRRYLPKATKLLMKNLLGQRTGPDEFELIRKDGKRITVEVSAFSVKRGGKVEVIGIARDITERNRMEERLLTSERLAAIGQAATMVGHDLRNPLQAIENGVFLLDTELANHAIFQKTSKTRQAIHNSIEYAANIVRDLQSFAEKRKPEFRETNINEIVNEALSCVKKPQNVETSIEVDQLPKIEADKDMVKQIFVNLAVNGIQAMEKNGGTLKVSTKKTDGFIEVSFQDKGIGIKKENFRKLFTPFFTTKAQGMGVGLAICKRFVELHNGSIKVESEEGEGSIFTVKLPIQRNGGVKLD